MIFLHIDDVVEGPFTAEELKELWNTGDVTPEAFYWYRGMRQWAPVTEFKPFDPDAARTPATAVRLTTGPAVANAQIETELDIITAEHAFGLTFLGDLIVELRDGWGGRSKKMQEALRSARTTCLTELRHEAWSIGADAVVGVDLDYTELTGGGKSMTLLVASGTAVRLAVTPPPFDAVSQ